MVVVLGLEGLRVQGFGGSGCFKKEGLPGAAGGGVGTRDVGRRAGVLVLRALKVSRALRVRSSGAC